MRTLLAISIVCAPLALAADFPPFAYTDHEYYGPYDNDAVLTRGMFSTALGVAILIDDPLFDGESSEEDHGYEVGLPNIRTKPVGGRYLVDSTR